MQPLSELLHSDTSVRWLFYGDSITHGALHTFGHRDFSELFREHIVWEMGRRQDLVLNTAYSGFTTAELLRDFDFRAAAFQPHCAFVMIGTNDCCKLTQEAFRNNLDELLQRFNAIDCRLVLQTPVPLIKELNSYRAAIDDYTAILRQFAHDHTLDFIDHETLWNALPLQDRFYLLSDPIHPNGEGHVKIAQDIFRFMGCFNPENATCRRQPGPRLVPEGTC